MKRVGLQINRLNLCCSFIFLCLVLTSFGYLQAETRILNSTTMKVTPGTMVTMMDNLLLDNGGVLNNQGTMVIKGNLVNNNSSPSNLGTGTFIFQGSSAQTISGQNIFQHLTISNSAGVTMLNDNQVNGPLELTNGLLKLKTANLTLGDTLHVLGVPSGSIMISADSTGQVRRLFTGTGSFLFPVGDSTGHYTPVTLNFTGGTFGGGAYAGVNLRQRKYSDSLTTDYLKRYWTVTTNAITGSVACTASFKYVTGDWTGTESNLYCLRMSPLTTYSATNTGTHTLTANTLNSFGVFTGGHSALTSSLIAFLEGPFNGTIMKDSLRTAPTFPLAQQPYNVPPWNYLGTEHVGSVAAGIVDWVLIELRQAAAPGSATTYFARRAALIKSDGTIVDVDGTSPVKFYNATITGGNNLYTVIRHRNHLAIIANNAVTMDVNGVYNYNYTTGQGQVYPGTGAGHKQIAAGVWGMTEGNSNGDGTISTLDFGDWQTYFGLSNTYNKADFNCDKSVSTLDFGKWSANFGLSSTVP